MTDKITDAWFKPSPERRQFVLIGDSHTVSKGTKFNEINAIINRLSPPPEFICLAGDHIWGDSKWEDRLSGLPEDENALKAGWEKWRSQNRDILSHRIFHCTGNHTVFGPVSAAVYSKEFSEIPKNGPERDKSLNYFIREGNLLLIVVNTAWNHSCASNSEGRSINNNWVEEVLKKHSDASCKLVMGHHPVFPVNGFTGGWLVEQSSGRIFWELLVRYKVKAYLCAHLIAFDVLAREGVLQVTSGGGGFPYFFEREEVEYHHCVRAAVEPLNIRLRALDLNGTVRESLDWPFNAPPEASWPSVSGKINLNGDTEIMLLRFRGQIAVNSSITLLNGLDAKGWIGIENNRLRVRLQPIAGAPGKTDTDAMSWEAELPEGVSFDVCLALHPGMRQGGILLRSAKTEGWSSLDNLSWHDPFSAESWPKLWETGKDITVNIERLKLRQ